MRLPVRSFKNFPLIVFVRRSAKRRSLTKAILIVGCRQIGSLAPRAVCFFCMTISPHWHPLDGVKPARHYRHLVPVIHGPQAVAYYWNDTINLIKNHRHRHPPRLNLVE